MSVALGFDVYGTLVDPLRMDLRLRILFGDHADAMSALWRQTQLEYSFRRGLMRRYENFDASTRRALAFALRTFKAELSDSDEQQLIRERERNKLCIRVFRLGSRSKRTKAGTPPRCPIRQSTALIARTSFHNSC
jgi:FMN phosphatase YigB (HAD superfamily)